jgi:hypothetical protein
MKPGPVGVLLLFIIVVGVLALTRRAKRQGGSTDEVWLFFARSPLTPPEQVPYFRLIKALPNHIMLA